MQTGLGGWSGDHQGHWSSGLQAPAPPPPPRTARKSATQTSRPQAEPELLRCVLTPSPESSRNLQSLQSRGPGDRHQALSLPRSALTVPGPVRPAPGALRPHPSGSSGCCTAEACGGRKAPGPRVRPGCPGLPEPEHTAAATPGVTGLRSSWARASRGHGDICSPKAGWIPAGREEVKRTGWGAAQLVLSVQ